jgi:hypothetical protein
MPLPEPISQPAIADRIFLIRGQRVMIDRDLADLYGVETKHLNRQVRRNAGRFPPTFMFPLTAAERAEVVTICHHLQHLKFSRVLPRAFTEYGVVMLASVLNNERAVRISVSITEAFIRLRRMVASQADLAEKLAKLEGRVDKHDVEIRAVIDALRKMLTPPAGPRPVIGFTPPPKGKRRAKRPKAA